MKVLPHPKPVTTQKNQLELPACDQCSPEVQNIWGHSARQLLEGGRWDPKDKMPVPQTSNGRIRSKRKVKTPYEGFDIIEPAFEISQAVSVREIVRSLWRSGRCEGCIRHIVSNPDHKGAGFALWAPEWLDEVISTTDSTDDKSYYFTQMHESFIVIGTSPEEPITMNQPKPFKAEPHLIRNILAWMQMNPGAPQQAIIDARLISDTSVIRNSTGTRKYLDHMVEEGLLSVATVKNGKRGGQPKIFSIVGVVDAPMEFEPESLTLKTNAELGLTF